MKQLNTYIIEKLKLSKDTKNNYKYFPKTKGELISILEEKSYRSKRKLDLNDIDVSEITDMSELFRKCNNLSEVEVSNWDTSNVINMEDMFKECKNIKKISCENWDVSNVTNMKGVFNFCKNLEMDLSFWDVSKMELSDGMFCGCSKFTGKGLENWNVKNLESAIAMFAGCNNINFDINAWKPENLKKMTFMFSNCTLKAPSWYSRKI